MENLMDKFLLSLIKNDTKPFEFALHKKCDENGNTLEFRFCKYLHPRDERRSRGFMYEKSFLITTDDGKSKHFDIIDCATLKSIYRKTDDMSLEEAINWFIKFLKEVPVRRESEFREIAPKEKKLK